MIDFHSHILPGIDDGSRDTDESLALLRMCSEQGITHIAATPHFYPADDSPERFLRRRDEALRALSEKTDGDAPRIIPGAEVYYFAGISRNDEILDLRIGDTGILLLEMPFAKWAPSMFTEIKALHGKRGVRVMLAHIERYMKYQDPGDWESLLEAGIIMQSNAEFFIDWRTKHKALRLFRTGRIHVLGSDCHNLKSRTENMGRALDILTDGDRRILEHNLRAIVGGSGSFSGF